MTGRVITLFADLAGDPVDVARRFQVKFRLARLRLVNRFSRRSVTGHGRVAVNLTSFGHRIDSVFYAVETIAAGAVKPCRLILWLDDESVLADLPPSLERLRDRGVEILQCPDYGPHKKQYPYALTAPQLPLVAADDDVLYPRNWLAELLSAAARHPEDVCGQRAHTIVFDGDAVAPYSQWTRARSTESSFRRLCTGVSGIYYPPGLLTALRLEGLAFQQAAPRADDLWVHAVAVRHGIRARQVSSVQAEYPAIPGTQRGTLYRENVADGGNDIQWAASVGAAEIARMRRDDPYEFGPLPGVATVSTDGD